MTQYEQEKERAREKIKRLEKYLEIPTLTPNDRREVEEKREQLISNYGLREEVAQWEKS